VQLPGEKEEEGDFGEEGMRGGARMTFGTARGGKRKKCILPSSWKNEKGKKKGGEFKKTGRACRTKTAVATELKKGPMTDHLSKGEG